MERLVGGGKRAGAQGEWALPGVVRVDRTGVTTLATDVMRPMTGAASLSAGAVTSIGDVVTSAAGETPAAADLGGGPSISAMASASRAASLS